MVFIKISNFHFYFITFNSYIGYYCSINIKRRSEHSGLCPDTSSLVLFLVILSCGGMIFMKKFQIFFLLYYLIFYRLLLLHKH